MNLDQILQPYLEKFPGDFTQNPMQRQTPKVLFATVNPVGFPKAELILFNEKLSSEIGLGNLEKPEDEQFLLANFVPQNLKFYATAYAGHQFGNWAGQLGDGRAINIGEILNTDGKATELQYKGAGATPYSRHADGRAVLRSSVREYLMSEAMHFLKIPTTRALSLALTGEEVVRDMMYDGHPKTESGAVIIRTAATFLRFGHFELISAQKELDTLQNLTDFTIERYFPEIKDNTGEKYKSFFRTVCKKTAELMVEWQRVGFVHGVMNTDNMSIAGLTIDYGPFSMMDGYDLNFTPNTTDLPGRRYAFGSQPQMAQWNLWQLANALFPLIKDEKFLEESLDEFSHLFWDKYDRMLRRKFGFDRLLESDEKFFNEWQNLMQTLELDYTLFFQLLENYEEKHVVTEYFKPCFYKTLSDENGAALANFAQNYLQRKAKNKISNKESLQLMRENNPKFILRNYLLYECIAELEVGKTDLLNQLLLALQDPYKEIFPAFSQRRPNRYNGIVGCSTLSCSS